VLAACGTDTMSGNESQTKDVPSDVYYKWDDRQVLCSVPIDDLTGVARNWTAEESRIRDASTKSWVTFAHAHIPGMTVSRDALEHIFTLADQYHLDYVTFTELANNEDKRGALAFAFDDWSVNEWLSIRDILTEHHAKVTFFVAKWQTLTPDEIAGIAQLAADGHDIEPHSVNHVHAVDYEAEHGAMDYVLTEVVPSIQTVRAAGYTPTSYAYPFGEHDATLDGLVLQYIDRVRTTPGECPP
jgi:hypothetical protein